jgi:hypothetical protein
MTPTRPMRRRPLAAVLLAAALAAAFSAACDDTLDPWSDNTVGPFAIYGYLDLNADTQWVRVAPVRRNLLPEPQAIDAVVTLEELGSGRVITLSDSLFTFTDPSLGAIGYAHNFWTTERLDPEATYRLVARRSDGATTTATVEMPPLLNASLRYWDMAPDRPGVWEPRRMQVEGEHLLYTEVVYTVWEDEQMGDGRPATPFAQRLAPRSPGVDQWEFTLPGVGAQQALNMPPLRDMFRRMVRVAAVRADWPFEPGLSPTEAAVPGQVPTTVENGVGALVGTALLTVPLPLCQVLEPVPGGGPPCDQVFHRNSATVVGRVARDPCSAPRPLTRVRLTERFASGGAIVRSWLAGWDGEYRFEGIEPGSELVLDFEGHPEGTLQIQPLGPAGRFYAPEVHMPSTCGLRQAAQGPPTQGP